MATPEQAERPSWTPWHPPGSPPGHFALALCSHCGMVEHGGLCPPPDPSRCPTCWRMGGAHDTAPHVHKGGRMVGIAPEDCGYCGAPVADHDGDHLDAYRTRDPPKIKP